MVKQFLRPALVALTMVLTVSGLSCAGGPATSQTKKVTYKCLSSSCDATVVCNEGDPVPQHCGKPMIR